METAFKVLNELSKHHERMAASQKLMADVGKVLVDNGVKGTLGTSIIPTTYTDSNLETRTDVIQGRTGA